jgi:hypothetical protein
MEQQRAAAADAQRRLHSAGAMPPPPGRSSGGDNSDNAAPAAASAAARLRFSVDGRPVGFAPDSASAAPSATDVLQRDPLRCGGGTMVPCTCAHMKFWLQICRCTGWGTRTARFDYECGLQQPICWSNNAFVFAAGWTRRAGSLTAPTRCWRRRCWRAAAWRGSGRRRCACWPARCSRHGNCQGPAVLIYVLLWSSGVWQRAAALRLLAGALQQARQH